MLTQCDLLQIHDFHLLCLLHLCQVQIRYEPMVSVPVVLHAGEDRNPVQDGGMWDWFTPAGWADSGDAATEVTYPKRLVQQIESEEEMAHDHLDTRVKNGTGDTSVSCN